MFDDIINLLKMRTALEFKHGQLVKIDGNRVNITDTSTYDLTKIYSAEVYIIGGYKYDLTKIKDIQKIPVIYKNKQTSISSPVFDLPYILRMGGKTLYDKGMQENCFECMRKAISIYEHTNDEYSLKATITELQNHMLKYGKIDEAEAEYNKLSEKYDYIMDEIKSSCLLFQKILNDAKELETDLLIMDTHWGCCGECSKYQGRVYSITGKTKEFPKLPKQVFEYGGIHKGCRHLFHPFILGIDTNNYDDKANTDSEIIQRSNRPFLDERTQEEITAYEEYISQRKKEEIQNTNRIEYYKILNKYPDKAPKSLGAYSRMKNQNTKNYQKLVEFLQEEGFDN